MVRAALVLSCLALGSGALADEPGPPAGPFAADLAAARAAIDALDYPEAVNVLEALLRRGGADPEVVARAYELMAVASASSGEEAQAAFAYERLLALEPAWQPPAQLSPRLASALARARAELPEGAALSVALRRPERAALGHALTATLVAERDALGLVRGARLRYRAAGARAWSQVTVRGAAPLEVVVPAAATASVGALELWAAALDEHGNEVAWIGGPQEAIQVPVAAASGGGAAHSGHGAGHGPRQGSRSGVLGQWWFWTGLVVVVAGAAVAGVLLAQPEPDCPANRSCFDVRVEAGAIW